MPSRAKKSAQLEGLLLLLKCETSYMGDMFLAEYKELGLSDQGRDREEALRNLQVSLRLFLEECDRHGELEEILSQRGVWFTHIKGDKAPPANMRMTEMLSDIRTREMGLEHAAEDQPTLFIPTRTAGRRTNAI